MCSTDSNAIIGYRLLVHQNSMRVGAKATKFVMLLRFTQPILQMEDINVTDASDAQQFIDNAGILQVTFLKLEGV